MIIKEIDGNLLDEFEKGTIDMLVHGANCFHIMGAGIAGQLRHNYPRVFKSDLKTPCGDITKLGTSSITRFKRSGSYRFIVNAYTQFEPGANFEYSALITFLKQLNYDYAESGLIIGFPQIGCGIGGAKWGYVRDIIDKHTTNLKIVIVNYDNGQKTVGTTKANIQTKIEGLE
jgi:O-acetyl-ADP-ribose deacetylase (regulator of RNase III)